MEPMAADLMGIHADRETEAIGPPKMASSAAFIHSLMLYFVEGIDNVNYEVKCKELFEVLTEDNVQVFLKVLVENRISKDDINLEMLADLVFKINERFPETRELAIKELLKPIHKMFGSIPANGFDYGMEADLRNLGRFMGLLTLIKNKTILQYHLDLRALLIEGIIKGDSALRYAVQFVCQFLKASQGLVYHPFYSSIVRILRYLRMIYEKDDVTKIVETELTETELRVPLGDPIIKFEQSTDSPSKDNYRTIV
ncbi:unnamed protein product [Rodentolepis nana]|uniref:CNOT1_CAF1_bind domain-containing protein n=1 Tax=Rodentolepis nana TaxID=102285 RepID=A0A0R3TUB0_RODNA|nr:unnamed protein product [Rodentolepis nana]